MSHLSDQILDWFDDRSRHGTLGIASHVAVQANPSCGDMVRFYLDAPCGWIEKIRYSVAGCTLTRAGASMLAARFDGARLADVFLLTDQEMLKLAGVELTFQRRPCWLLGLHALKAAVASPVLAVPPEVEA